MRVATFSNDDDDDDCDGDEKFASDWNRRRRSLMSLRENTSLVTPGGYTRARLKGLFDTRVNCLDMLSILVLVPSCSRQY